MDFKGLSFFVRGFKTASSSSAERSFIKSKWVVQCFAIKVILWAHDFYFMLSILTFPVVWGSQVLSQYMWKLQAPMVAVACLPSTREIIIIVRAGPFGRTVFGSVLHSVLLTIFAPFVEATVFLDFFVLGSSLHTEVLSGAVLISFLVSARYSVWPKLSAIQVFAIDFAASSWANHGIFLLDQFYKSDFDKKWQAEVLF